jgi:hypothetical protein
MSTDVQYIKPGDVLVATSDASVVGTYQRIGDPGTSSYVPVNLSVSSALTLGPFNEPRTYEFKYAGSMSYELSASGIFTAVDDSEKANLASPTFTGTVKLPNSQITITAYSSNGALSKSAGVAKLSKAGVGAYTLAAPTDVTDDGLILIITSTTANAHVVTATGLIEDGVTGGSKNTATFAAFAGASITLMALGAKWHVLSSNNVTVA